MLPLCPSSLLALVLLQGTPVEPPTTTCEDLQRIELALAPAAVAREICVSPGLMTNFVFDARADVELQDEVRFMEVTRGRSTFGFLPPRDMVPGERLRLTVHFGEGPSQQSVTFTLVAHSGQAMHQVEVYRDPRPRESFLHEIAQEQAKSRQLSERLEWMRARVVQMQAQLDKPKRLWELIANESITPRGIQAQEIESKLREPSDNGTLTFMKGVSYRTDKSVAAEVWLKNSSSEPWTAVDALLVDAQGKELKGVMLRQEEPIAPNVQGSVIVEVDAMRWQARGELTLTLRDEGARGITIPGVVFPESPPLR